MHQYRITKPAVKRERERENVCVSVENVCVLREPWLELLADCFLLLLLLLLRPNFEQTFLGALCLKLFFLKIECESEKFRARKVWDVFDYSFRLKPPWIQLLLIANILIHVWCQNCGYCPIFYAWLASVCTQPESWVCTDKYLGSRATACRYNIKKA